MRNRMTANQVDQFYVRMERPNLIPGSLGIHETIGH